MWTDSPLLRDAGAAMLTGVAAAVVLRFWEEVANRALLEQVKPESSTLFLSGVADIFGRRFGRVKLPYNPEKSYAGSIAMFLAGFIASILYMCYFRIFGFVDKSWTMVAAFGVISLVAAAVESLPISTRLDDNLTVPVASVLFGALVFYSIGARNLCCMSSEDKRSISATVGMVFAGGGSSSS